MPPRFISRFGAISLKIKTHFRLLGIIHDFGHAALVHEKICKGIILAVTCKNYENNKSGKAGRHFLFWINTFNIKKLDNALNSKISQNSTHVRYPHELNRKIYLKRSAKYGNFLLIYFKSELTVLNDVWFLMMAQTLFRHFKNRDYLQQDCS